MPNMSKSLFAGDDLAEPQVQGAGEAGGIGADAGQPDRPLWGVGQNQLDRHHRGHHVLGWLDPGRPAVVGLRRLRRLGRGHIPRSTACKSNHTDYSKYQPGRLARR